MLLRDAASLYVSCRSLASESIRQIDISVTHWERFGNIPIESITAIDLSRFSVALAASSSPASANKFRRHVRAVLNWARDEAELISFAPPWKPLKEPRRAPLAFLADEFFRGLVAAREQPGWICGVPSGVWWESLLLATWYSGARIGAILQVTWEDVLDNGFFVRARYQKQACDQFFVIGDDAREAIQMAAAPERELVWPWPYRREALMKTFRRIFSRAGVKMIDGPGSLFHRIRKSTASYIKAAGGDATGQLGHSSYSVTRRYFDPRIVGAHDSTLFMPTAH